MKTIIGTVVSTSMMKTIVVEVTSFVMHPLYKKSMRRSKRFKVHNETEGITVGDTVKIQMTRPISKHKHFIVAEKIPGGST